MLNFHAIIASYRGGGGRRRACKAERKGEERWAGRGGGGGEGARGRAELPSSRFLALACWGVRLMGGGGRGREDGGGGGSPCLPPTAGSTYLSMFPSQHSFISLLVAPNLMHHCIQLLRRRSMARLVGWVIPEKSTVTAAAAAAAALNLTACPNHHSGDKTLTTKP